MNLCWAIKLSARFQNSLAVNHRQGGSWGVLVRAQVNISFPTSAEVELRAVQRWAGCGASYWQCWLFRGTGEPVTHWDHQSWIWNSVNPGPLESEFDKWQNKLSMLRWVRGPQLLKSHSHLTATVWQAVLSCLCGHSTGRAHRRTWAPAVVSS